MIKETPTVYHCQYCTYQGHVLAWIKTDVSFKTQNRGIAEKAKEKVLSIYKCTMYKPQTKQERFRKKSEDAQTKCTVLTYICTEKKTFDFRNMYTTNWKMKVTVSSKVVVSKTLN